MTWRGVGQPGAGRRIAMAAAALAICAAWGSAYAWRLRRGSSRRPPPPGTVTRAKVELGRQLF